MARRSPSVRPRNQRGPRERNARSQAVRRVAEQSLLRGSLVEMSRVCGKKNCRCQQGQKHRALYLAVRRNNRRANDLYSPRLGRHRSKLDRDGPRGRGTAGRDFSGVSANAPEQERGCSYPQTQGEAAMMARFCAYAEKVFSLGTRMGMLRATRVRIPSFPRRRFSPRPCLPRAILGRGRFYLLRRCAGSLVRAAYGGNDSPPPTPGGAMAGS